MPDGINDGRKIQHIDDTLTMTANVGIFQRYTNVAIKGLAVGFLGTKPSRGGEMEGE